MGEREPMEANFNHFPVFPFALQSFPCRNPQNSNTSFNYSHLIISIEIKNCLQKRGLIPRLVVQFE